MTRRALAALVALAGFTAGLSDGLRVHAQTSQPGEASAIETLVLGDRAITLSRTSCEASQTFTTTEGECTVLSAADVPTSTLAAPVGLRAAHGALVLAEHGGCSALIVGRSDPAHGLYVRGVESHVYPSLGRPHDTVCFGFSVRAIGEIRVGTRPLGRGRHGEIRHAVATRVLVAVTSLASPVSVREPSVMALDGSRIAFTTPVGADGEVIESASLDGTHALVVVSDGEHRREVTLDARSGQRRSVRALPARSETDAER